MGLGAKARPSLAAAAVSCYQPRRAVPAALSYGEGAGLMAALRWGGDKKFMFLAFRRDGASRAVCNISNGHFPS